MNKSAEEIRFNELQHKMATAVHNSYGRSGLNHSDASYNCAKIAEEYASQFRGESEEDRNAFMMELDKDGWVKGGDNELKRLYEWLIDEKRKSAQTFFTAGWLRNVAREIEFRFKSVQSKESPVCDGSEHPYTHDANKWLQGYMCAIANIIKMDGIVDSKTRELFRAGVGQKSLQALREEGVNQNDLEIIEEHWAQLWGT